MRTKREKNVLQMISEKKLFTRFTFFFIACFLYAAVYNLFLVPNQIVVGGMSGLAIVINALTGLKTTYFIYASSAIIIILAYLFLGKEKVYATIIGTITYTIMVSLTENISNVIAINNNNQLLFITLCGFLQGISNGIIYRSGFNTGGSDVLASILNKLIKIPIGKANAITNTFIIASGTYLFGLEKTIFAVSILLISSKLIDVIMIGMNDSKVIIVKSREWENIKEELVNEFHLGVTLLGTPGGIFKKRIPTIMTIVPIEDYYAIKHRIFKIDCNSFFVSNDCYAVLNGYRKRIIPF